MQVKTYRPNFIHYPGASGFQSPFSEVNVFIPVYALGPFAKYSMAIVIHTVFASSDFFYWSAALFLYIQYHTVSLLLGLCNIS